MIKVKFALEQATKAQRGVELLLYSFFNLGARWGRWLRTRSGHFTPGKENGYLLYRRLGGPQRRSGRMREISLLAVFDPQAVQPVPSRYTDCAVTAHPQYIKATTGHSDQERQIVQHSSSRATLRLLSESV